MYSLHKSTHEKDRLTALRELVKEIEKVKEDKCFYSI